jgi:hypothetical protein
MLFLGTSPTEPDIQYALTSHKIGLMCQPKSNSPRAGWLWAADNGCGPPRSGAPAWREDYWLNWLRSGLPRSGCLFATVPDVVADHDATMERWRKYSELVASLRYPLAFVGQNGATESNVPWDEFDCFFIGGDTRWKMGEAFPLALAAHERGKWVHVGRINSGHRFLEWASFADSCDGTILSFGPKKNLSRVTEWIDISDTELSLWGRDS